MKTPFRPTLGLAALISCGAVLAPIPAAHAHPHVWVLGEATLRFQDDKLARVGMRWQFDAFFSQVLTGDFDTSKDGTFDAAELEAMQAQIFTSLKDYGYFTHLRVDDAETTFEGVENFKTATDKGELIFFFDLVPSAPIDPRTSQVQLAVYDPTLYVDIVLGGEKPVTLDGLAAGTCLWEFKSGDDISANDAFMTPQVMKLNCPS
ncbi:MAG: DUF1007 family protein [Rhodospirillaceae bacterium]|nr:DUF1007 family protein [Rhodospirillaceae bacterium]